MCTALVFRPGGSYFGRTLDYERSFGEHLAIAPRAFPLHFRMLPTLSHHPAIAGMAHVEGGFPLYYDAFNEAGLAIAGLNFPENACYFPPDAKKTNLAPFELPLWLLGQCESLAQARALLSGIHLAALPFSPSLPLTPLHWLLADRSGSVCIESTAQGLRVHDNPIEVLTNNPPFEQMCFHLSCFRHLSAKAGESSFSPRLSLPACSRGMGALGLPGDFSSPSRFVRAAFVKENSLCGPGAQDEVNQLFHIMRSVEQPMGCVRLESGEERTLYTCCCDLNRLIYFYTTYENGGLSALHLTPEAADGTALRTWPLQTQPHIFRHN